MRSRQDQYCWLPAGTKLRQSRLQAAPSRRARSILFWFSFGISFSVSVSFQFPELFCSVWFFIFILISRSVSYAARERDECNAQCALKRRSALRTILFCVQGCRS